MATRIPTGSAISVAIPTITIVPTNAFRRPCGAFVRLNWIGSFVIRFKLSAGSAWRATEKMTTPRMPTAIAAAIQASASITRLTAFRRGSRS